MIVKEEQPDSGQVAVDRGTTIGYFSQDVGEMKRDERRRGDARRRGPVSEVATRLRTRSSTKLADPEFGDQLEKVIEEFGDAQARFDELGGYALDARAREILAGLGFAQRRDGRPTWGKLSGGWKMRVALARILLMRPDACSSTSRPTTSTSSRSSGSSSS
jgi:ATPase subunit of ABC transporter with duplicated ATPase domains